MDYLTLAAVLWLSVFVLIGLIRGFWTAFAALASLVAAYAASVYLARPVSQGLMQIFDNAGLSPTFWWLACATGLFLIMGLLVRLLVLALGRVLPFGGPLNRLGGALASSVYGALLGIFLIWGFAFAQENMATAQGQALSTKPGSGLVDFSRRAVAKLVDWNVRQGGGSEASAELTAALAERPGEVLSGIRETVQSQAFIQAVNNADVQEAVIDQDPERLRMEPSFQELLKAPGVQNLRKALAEGGVEWTDDEIAEHTVVAVTTLERVRNDPEFIALYEDPEVQAFLAGQTQLSPTLMQKGQQLLRLISQKVDANEQPF